MPGIGEGAVTTALLAIAIAVGLVAAAPASAVAPGANGKLLYTLQTPGNFDIWTINADGSGNTPVVTDATSDQGGSWSPDGTKIAFRSDRTGAGDIYIADADGSDQLRLTTDPGAEAHPSFSPDGTRIAFTRKDPDDEIFVMNVDGSDVQRRTDNTITDAGPDWSPDGARIAFFRGNNVIHVMNADGSNQRELVPGNFSVGPQWSPDARRVLFNRGSSAPNDANPFAVEADGTGLVNLGAMVPNSQSPSWAPDGTKIVLLAGNGESDIWIMSADGTGPVKILDDALVRSGPRWQPIPRAPTALTGAPTDITTASAKLNGTIDSSVLHPTTYWFEYGTTTAYGARTADAGAPSPVGRQAVSADIAALLPYTTYHARLVARNANGTTVGADQVFITGVNLSRYAISPRSFLAATSGPSARTTQNKRRKRAGGKVSFRLNQAASVAFKVKQRRRGRRDSRGRCVKPTRQNRSRRRCTRLVTLRGGFTRAGKAGRNSFRFTGRLRRRKLEPGRYLLVATPTADGKAGRARSTSFRIKRPGR